MKEKLYQIKGLVLYIMCLKFASLKYSKIIFFN